MGSTTSSDLMVLTTLAVISCLMAAETYLTMKLAQSILCALWPSVGESSKATINILVCLWQLVSYLISPFVCYQKGLATRNGQSSAENLWKKAEPVKRVGEGFYAAGQVIWWGLPGIFVFAPAVWKWAWAGKTVLGSNQVRMLQFKAINLVPTYWIFTLPLLGDAVLDKSDKFEGKTSMAFCYKYLPIVDHLRKLDDKTLIGKMKIGSYTIIYFTLTVPGN